MSNDTTASSAPAAAAAAAGDGVPVHVEASTFNGVLVTSSVGTTVVDDKSTTKPTKLRKKRKVDEHRRVISRVPTYIDVKALEEFAASLNYLEIVLVNEVDFDHRRHYNMYLKFLKHSPFEDTLPKIVTIDDVRLTIDDFDPTTNLGLYESSKPLLVMNECQSMQPSNCHTFTYVKDSLPPVICQYCRDEITETYHTPCLHCSWTLCGACLRRSFEVALEDHECMPAQHCGRAMHPDVTRGIWDEEHRARYKARFEEMCTKKPFYCANPTCSVFIPPRKLRVAHERVTCHKCKTTTCFKCRFRADKGHSCAKNQSEEDDMLQKFGYKRCPKCRTGQARMFGCSHMRCPCGTHWCWDCDAVSNMCRCEGAETPVAEESEDTLWEDSDDDEAAVADEFVQASHGGPSETSTLQAEVEPLHEQFSESAEKPETSSLKIVDQDDKATTPVVSTREPELPIEAVKEVHTADNMEQPTKPESAEAETGGEGFTNLDSDDIEWEHEDLNFGGDPSDRSTDPFDCPHYLTTVHRDQLPKYWLSPMNPRWRDIDVNNTWELTIDCMLCQRHMKLALQGAAIDNEKYTANQCVDCGSMCCGRCRKRIERRRAKQAES